MTVEEAIGRIRAWGEDRDWRGYDPYDGLNTPFARLLTLETRLGKRLLTQAVKLSPVNLRPLLRIAPDWNQKAVALVASAYTRLAGAGVPDAGTNAARWLDWLLANRASGDGTAWGYHFPVQTRVFGYARNAPNTIATSFAAHALLEGFELLEGYRWGEAAGDAADFLVERMLVDENGKTYFRYLAREGELVHNANLLACSVLARAAGDLHRPELAEVAARALRVTLDAQRPDGAWPYAEGRGHGWVDNYHTAYVLQALARCVDLASDAAERLDRGVAYWERALFLVDGTPKYFDDRVYPLDAHNYAEAVETWVALTGRRADALVHAERAARLLVEDMLDPRGHAVFQRFRFGSNRVPLVRWTTAPSFRALAGLVLARSRLAVTA